MSSGSLNNNEAVKPGAGTMPESTAADNRLNGTPAQQEILSGISALKGQEHVRKTTLPGLLREKLELYVQENAADPLKGRNLAGLYNNMLSPDERRFIAGDCYAEPGENTAMITDKLRQLLTGEKLCTPAGGRSISDKLRSFFSRMPPAAGENTRQGNDDVNEMEKLLFPLAVRIEDMPVYANEIARHAQKLPGLNDITDRSASLMLGDHVLASGRIIAGENDSPAFETGNISLNSKSGRTALLTELLLDYPLNLSVEIGRTSMPINEASCIGPGTVISFGKPADTPVDLVFDDYDMVIARGEVVALDDNFGIRITDYTCDGISGILSGERTPRGRVIDEVLHVPLKCILGKRKVTVKDFSGLGEGSIIELDTTVFTPVEVLAGGDIKLKGEVVVIAGNFGVRIVDETRAVPMSGGEYGDMTCDDSDRENVTDEDIPGGDKPFAFLVSADAGDLVNFLQGEHLQAIALVLSFLSPGLCASVIAGMPYHYRGDIARRIAGLKTVSSEVIRDIENVLERKMAMLNSSDSVRSGGIDSVVEMLGMSDREMEKAVMSSLDENDPELAGEIKKRIFMFEDIIYLDDRSLQKVLREVDTQDIVMSLKGVSAEVQEKIFRNMSKRASALIREDMDYMGPVRLKDVENAQQRIVSIIRKLEEFGEIIIVRPGEDKLVV